MEKTEYIRIIHIKANLYLGLVLETFLVTKIIFFLTLY